MKKNIGNLDRALRFIFGLALIGVGIYFENYIVSVIGVIPIGTALLRWCPLYTPLGINTGCTSCDNDSSGKEKDS